MRHGSAREDAGLKAPKRKKESCVARDVPCVWRERHDKTVRLEKQETSRGVKPVQSACGNTARPGDAKARSVKHEPRVTQINRFYQLPQPACILNRPPCSRATNTAV